MRRCVGSDPLSWDVSVSDFTGNQEKGAETPRVGKALPPSRALPGVGAVETLSPGPCCRMSHRAGIRACNGPVSIPPFRDLSVADGSGPCVPPGWDSTK